MTTLARKNPTAAIIALVAVVLGAAMMLGVNYISAPSAGANPLPAADNFDGECDSAGVDNGEPGDEASPGEVAECLALLNDGKKNEDGFEIRSGRVEQTTAGDGSLNVVFSSPFDNLDLAVDADQRVMVVLTPVRNNDVPNNAPVVIQAFGNSPTGFNVKVLNKQIQPIVDDEVVFTYVAYGVVETS